MTDTERRKRLVKWLDDILKTLRTLTVSTFVDAIEELREYINAGGEFSWDAHGIHERNVMNLLQILEGKINLLIGSGVSRWYQEGLDNAAEQVGEAVKKLTKSNRQPYGLRKLKQQTTAARRMEAVAGHAQTVSYRDGAMNNLSNRVWDLKDDSKKIIEKIVQDAIRDGKGVNETKNSVKEFLNTDDNGNMKHGGEPGVYKNPEKNCERLMRTEVNAAYRSAEIDSYNAMDIVLGYEIHLSGNHTTTRKNKKGETKIIHIKDICDQCAGKYPKDFVWFGWHPNCRCYITPITMTPAQFGAYMDAEDEGREKEYLESIMIKDFPDGFKKYFGEHSADIARAVAKNPRRQLPPWIEGNKNILPTTTTIKTIEGKTEYEMMGNIGQKQNDILRQRELQRQRDFNVDNDKKAFRQYKKNEEKSLKQKGKFSAKNANYYTGEICLESGDIEAIMFHCYNELEVNAAKELHNILPNLKNGKRIPLNPARPNYQDKINKGYLYYVYYDVRINDVDFVLECKVMDNGNGQKEFPYCLKEKQQSKI